MVAYKRGLARAVRAEQRNDLAGRHHEAEVADHFATIALDRHILNLKREFAHVTLFPNRRAGRSGRRALAEWAPKPIADQNRGPMFPRKWLR